MSTPLVPPAEAVARSSELVFTVQPTREALVWQQNRLAEARYKLNVREQKLLLYVISMLEPEAQDFGKCKVSVQGYAEMAGLRSDDLYQELRDTALSIREKTLVVEGVQEPGMPRPVKRHGSWFEYVDEAVGDGCVSIKLSSWLKPFLLQVRREFFKYKLHYPLNLKSEYSIRLYQWLKRWQFAGRKIETVARLRLQLGATEVDHEGRIVRENLAAYKHFKNKALAPALKEINARTDLSVGFREEKIKGSKAVGAIVFTIGANAANQARLEPVKLVPRAQMELTLDPMAEPESAPANPPPAPAFDPPPDDGETIDGWMEEFGLSPHQRAAVQEFVRAHGIAYVGEKAEIIRVAPRDNAARAFLAALKQDWKAPRTVKPARPPKPLVAWAEPPGWRAYLQKKYPDARLPETYASLVKRYPSLGEEVRRALGFSGALRPTAGTAFQADS